MNSQTSCFQIYLQAKAMQKHQLSNYIRKNKQTNNQAKHTIKNVTIFFVCVY